MSMLPPCINTPKLPFLYSDLVWGHQRSNHPLSAFIFDACHQWASYV